MAASSMRTVRSPYTTTAAGRRLLLNDDLYSSRTPSLSTSEDSEHSSASLRTHPPDLLSDLDIRVHASLLENMSLSEKVRMAGGKGKGLNRAMTSSVAMTRSNSTAAPHRVAARNGKATRTPRPAVCLPYLLRDPKILSAFLLSISWLDFLALSGTCRALFHLVESNASLKSVVFERFVPGYKSVSTSWDPRYAEKEVKAGMRELKWLMLSLAIPLHTYPMRALACVSNPSHVPLRSHISQEDEEIITYYQTLCLAYSRFVLLLRFRSLLLPFQDSWLELEGSSTGVSRMGFGRGLQSPSMFSSMRYPGKGYPSFGSGNTNGQAVRELTFPAPLSFFDNNGSASSNGAFLSSTSSVRSSSSAAAGRNGSIGGSRLHRRSRETALEGPSDLASEARTGSGRPLRKFGGSSESTTTTSSGSSPSPPVSTMPSPYQKNMFPPSAFVPGNFESRSTLSHSSSASSYAPRKRRVSLFRSDSKYRVPLPAPQSEPNSMRFYSSRWRRVSHGLNQEHAQGYENVSGPGYPTRTYGLGPQALSEDEYAFAPPRRPWQNGSREDRRVQSQGHEKDGYRYGHNRSGSNTGSIRTGSTETGSGNASVTSLPSTRNVYSNGNGSSLNPLNQNSSYFLNIPSAQIPSNKGPHDIASNSSIRTRAKVLRAFVPCIKITGEVLMTIEKQLHESGLWKYLLVGDVVCNLGYMGSTLGSSISGSRSGASSSSYLPSADPGAVDSQGHTQRGYMDESVAGAGGRQSAEWLVFTGDRFIPLQPSTVRDPLMSSLPSPFYYADLLPYDPIVALTLPRPTRSSRNSRNSNRAIPELTLLLSSSPVPSISKPHRSFKVRKYIWLTSIEVSHEACKKYGIGEGWAGEWVLEADGTKECKLCLEQALYGDRTDMNYEGAGELIWEVIKERSGDGRLWLRLLSQPRSNHNPAATAAFVSA